MGSITHYSYDLQKAKNKHKLNKARGAVTQAGSILLTASLSPLLQPPSHTPFLLAWHLSSPVTLDVPRSTIRSTSPVRRPRCQRSESSCRWEKRRSSTRRDVNCCTRIHRNVRRLLTKPGGAREASERLGS